MMKHDPYYFYTNVEFFICLSVYFSRINLKFRFFHCFKFSAKPNKQISLSVSCSRIHCNIAVHGSLTFFAALVFIVTYVYK